MKKEINSFVWGLFIAAAAQADVIVDFDAAAGPANVVGDITVVLDIAADGSATLNSIIGTGAGVPAAEVSGSVSAAPAAPYQMTMFVETFNGRQTGIGLVGVGNNHIDPGETMHFSFDLDGAPVGSVLTVTEMAVDPDNATADTADGSIVGGTSGRLAIGFSGTGREAFDTTALGTSVAQGSGLTLAVDLEGGTVPRYQFAAITYDVIPEPSALGLMALAGLLVARRRRTR